MRQPNSWARSTTASENARHSKSGSAPDQQQQVVAGGVGAGPQLDRRPGQAGDQPVDQVHDRSAGPVVEQPVGVELGDDLGVRCRSRSADMALTAPSPASIHPSSATTITGSCSSGCEVAFDQGGHVSRSPRRRRDGQLARRVEHCAEAGHLLLGHVAHGPAGIAGVDAGDDAGQLPVAEGDVEVDVRHVAARCRGVALDQLALAGEAVQGGGGGLGQDGGRRRRRTSRPRAAPRRPAGRPACRSPSRGRP